jgi:hypothetical protein
MWWSIILLENEAVCNVLPTCYDGLQLLLLDMLAQVWTEVEYCYNVCRAVHGAHIELH